MKDELDKAIFKVAYHHIVESDVRRVSGSTIWRTMSTICPGLAPVTVPARIRRLIRKGLLTKDRANSSSGTKVYAPTEKGYKAWQELNSQSN